MTRGRKPTPTALKVFRGNPGKRPLNRCEPAPAAGQQLPGPPAHLAPAAREEWGRVAPVLHGLGLLSAIDVAALAGYCAAYARWARAEEVLAASGEVIVAKGSGDLRPNPYLHVANAALRQMHAFASEFGMTPASRTRIVAAPPGDREAQKFFDGEG